MVGRLGLEPSLRWFTAKTRSYRSRNPFKLWRKTVYSKHTLDVTESTWFSKPAQSPDWFIFLKLGRRRGCDSQTLSGSLGFQDRDGHSPASPSKIWTRRRDLLPHKPVLQTGTYLLCHLAFNPGCGPENRTQHIRLMRPARSPDLTTALN